MRIKKNFFMTLLSVLMFLMTQVGPAFADKPLPSTIIWDGSTPMQAGPLYALPDCKTSDPKAPCYVMISGGGTNATQAFSVMALTQTLRCTVNVYNSLGGLVAQLWEDINVTWNTSTYSTANWGSRGTWTTNGLYSWANLSGPNPTPPWTIVYSSGGKVFSSWGDLKYFGSFWNNHRVDMNIVGNQSWYCTGF